MQAIMGNATKYKSIYSGSLKTYTVDLAAEFYYTSFLSITNRRISAWTHSAYSWGQVFPAQFEDEQGLPAGHVSDVGPEAFGSCGCEYRNFIMTSPQLGFNLWLLEMPLFLNVFVF